MAPQPLIPLVAMVGLMLANYAIYVEHQASVNPMYVALCDGSWYSCTKVIIVILDVSYDDHLNGTTGRFLQANMDVFCLIFNWYRVVHGWINQMLF